MSSSSELEGFHAFITGAAGIVGNHVIHEFLGMLFLSKVGRQYRPFQGQENV